MKYENENEFIDNADESTTGEEDTKNYKSIGIHFTKREFEMLTKLSKAQNRSKLNTIKHLILSNAAAL
jgi:hypothetical protein